MVEVEGNFLTPEHYVARGNGTWSTAGELTPPGSESRTKLARTKLARIVYNIKLQKGDHIELGNRIYAATLGARFDTAGSEEEPTYSEEDSRYLQDLPGYSSGHIHWAPGAASVDRHGMLISKRPTDPPSKIGTSTLWRSTFYRKRERVRDRIRSLREPIDPLTTPKVRNILEVLRIYPATLDIQVEAMKILQWRISHINKQGNHELEHFAGRSCVNTLYSALSRHILRPNPYAAQDLNSQIQEHTAVTPRATRMLCLGTLILESLEKIHHRCPTAIPIVLNSLRVLTAGRNPWQKIG